MKRLLALTLVLSMLLAAVPAAVAVETTRNATAAEIAVAELNAGSDFYYDLVESYADSDIEHRTELRWWMAEGGHTDETLLEEVQAMYDAGFRGVELCQLDVSSMDETVWGYGSEQWNHDFHLVLNKALDLGMTVGITSGTNWNTTNVPGLDPDSQAAMQTVFETHEVFAAETKLKDHVIPTSKTTSGGCGGSSTTTVAEAAQWVGAYAYKIVDSASKPVILGDVVDVTAYVTENEEGVRVLNWTIPEDGEWYVFYCWTQGTHQESNPSVEPSYCVNYYDARGVEAWKEFFKANVLNDPELNAKILNGDVQLFMDSIETNTGDGFVYWSENFAQEFQNRKGYDIRPYLVLADGLPTLWSFEPDPTVYGTYNLSDAGLAQRILNDLHDVQTELYMENFMIPMEQWLNEYGIALRAQISYGTYMENSEPSMIVDYPEAENLNQRNQLDIYRLWTGAAKLENKTLSSETGAMANMSYGYDLQTHMQEAYHLYAAGFSRINWHIWTASWAPQTVWENGGSLVVNSWPGFQSMSFFHVFGTREPTYEMFWEFNQHLGRVQEFMREGKARSDIGMIYMKYGQPLPTATSKENDMWMERHDYMLFPSMELQEHGYTYDYFSPEFLNSEDVYYDAETGTLELAGYKALVLWQDWLTVAGAEDILALAEQGMKVVIVDGAAVQTPYKDGDEALAEVMAELKTLDNVVCVETADDVMEAMDTLGVDPYAAFGGRNQQLVTQVRQDGDNLFLYAYNYCNGELHDGDDEDHGLLATEEIVMDGTFIPYYINAWTGEVVQVADYRWEDGKTVIELSLEYGDIALYAFEAVENEPEHVVSTEAESFVTNEGIILRTTESGTYETQLAYGRTVKTEAEVPAAFEITDWDLTVEAWNEGETMTRTDTFTDSKGNTSVEQNISTVKTNIDVELDKLTNWENIPEVGRGVSGKGYYSATFNWDGKADGAYLDFGTMLNSMKVTINGVQTEDVNMNNPVLDISAYLVEGENTIELEYCSNMTNVLLATGKIREVQPAWGSIGNIWSGYSVTWRSYGPAQAVVVPYVEENISVLENNDVTIALTGETDVTVDVAELAYDVTVSGAENLATATLSFTAENLSNVTVTPAEGWMAYAVTEENGIIEIVMGNLTGVNGEATIATVTGATNGKVGTASLTLVEAVLSAYVGDSETFVNVIYGETTVETTIDYSTFDVNQDGTVNQLDITRAQRYFGTDDPICDLDGNGVGITDLILILNNYSK